MFDTRTNTQIACDGVRVAWKASPPVPSGPAVYIRSIDGVVRVQSHSVRETPRIEPRTSDAVPTPAFGAIWKTMDGIRMPALRY